MSQQFPRDVLPLPPEGSTAAKVDVLIAGAGPVGLLLGCLLKQAGVDVAIVDPHVFDGQGSKAAVTMPRSFEQMELAGVGESLQSLGRLVKSARMSLGTNEWTATLSGLTNPGVQSRHTPRTVGQNYVEKALSDRYKELGGHLYRAARFVGFTDAPDAVAVQVERSAYVRPPAMLPEVPEHLREVVCTTFTASYLIGCDGKQSGVRSAMDVSYDGHDYPQTFLLADVEVPEEEIERVGFHEHTMHVALDSGSGVFLLFVHLQHTRWRTYCCQKGLTRDNLSPEFLQEKWQMFLPGPGPFKPTEFVDLAFFEISCKLAGSFRKGRVILAGDAAHCHSPAGGQGMNTGLQDAANLAWKLASVLKGHASEKLIDSYEPERKPIAEWVLQTSDGVFQGMTNQKSMLFNALRRRLLKTITTLAPTKLPPSFLVAKMFGLSHTYASAGTCRDTGRTRSSTVRAGDRLPDLKCVEAPDGTIFSLQLLNQAPHLALRLLLVAETGHPLEQAEIEAALLPFKSFAERGVPLQPILYGFSSRSKPCDLRSHAWKPAVNAEALAGFAAMRTISPANSEAGREKPCAELCARLGLWRGERALLVVRPDGYVAVTHVGNWNGTLVASTLEELGLVSAACAA